MENEVVSVVLLPADQKYSDFYEISSRLKESLFHLDDNHLPHVTLAQFVAPHSSVEELKSSLKTEEQIIEVETSGINFVPDIKLGITWVELLILKSAKLLSLQEKVLETSFSKKYKLQNWGINDTYRPHITLGAIKGTDTTAAMNISGMQHIIKCSLKTKIVVGKNGDYFSFSGE